MNSLLSDNKRAAAKQVVSDYDLENMEFLFWDFNLLADSPNGKITVIMMTKQHILVMDLSKRMDAIKRYRRYDCVMIEKVLNKQEKAAGLTLYDSISCVYIHFSNEKSITIPYPHKAFSREQHEFERFVEALEIGL